MYIENMLILSFDIGIYNLSFCLYDNTSRKIINWEVININPEKHKDRITIIKLLMRSLKTIIRPIDNTPEIIILEKQMRINSIMVCIQDCIISYYSLLGIEVKLINAIDKFSDTQKKVINEYKKSTGKKINLKKFSIDIVRNYLTVTNRKADLIILNSYKKKDDLCDSFLQAKNYCFV